MNEGVAGIFFALGLFTLVAVIIVVTIWQSAATKRAKASIEREEAYRKLAEKTAASQAETSKALTDIHSRVVSIEKLLREVE
ncbi:MAG: hypothetical protein ACRDXX_20190 [Stackebrandtia sp.]